MSYQIAVHLALQESQGGIILISLHNFPATQLLHCKRNPNLNHRVQLTWYNNSNLHIAAGQKNLPSKAQTPLPTQSGKLQPSSEEDPPNVTRPTPLVHSILWCHLEILTLPILFPSLGQSYYYFSWKRWETRGGGCYQKSNSHARTSMASHRNQQCIKTPRHGIVGYVLQITNQIAFRNASVPNWGNCFGLTKVASPSMKAFVSLHSDAIFHFRLHIDHAVAPEACLSKVYIAFHTYIRERKWFSQFPCIVKLQFRLSSFCVFTFGAAALVHVQQRLASPHNQQAPSNSPIENPFQRSDADPLE